jgi:hypothetical protein
MSAWGCPHEIDGLCERVQRAYCRPGMKGCVLVGKVEFRDGVIPCPVWPTAAELADRARERRRGRDF